MGENDLEGFVRDYNKGFKSFDNNKTPKLGSGKTNKNKKALPSLLKK